MYITPQEFFNLSGLTTVQVNQYYLSEVLENVSDQLDEAIGTTFSVERVTSREIYGNSMPLVKIGAWQPNDMVVRRYTIGSTTGQIQAIGRDYQKIYMKNNDFNNKFNPVVALVFSYPLSNQEYITIEGDLGFSNGLPSDLYNLLYQITKSLIEYQNNQNESGGKGIVTSERSISHSQSYAVADTEKITQLVYNAIHSNEAMKVINKYKRALSRNVG